VAFVKLLAVNLHYAAWVSTLHARVEWTNGPINLLRNIHRRTISIDE